MLSVREHTRGVGAYKCILAERNNREVKGLLKIDDSKPNSGVSGQHEPHSNIKCAIKRPTQAGLELGILP